MTSPRADRWIVLIAAVAMQLCLGATYSWAVFVAPLRRAGGMSQAAAQLPFTVFYYVFPLTLTAQAIAPWRLAPHRVAALGGAIFGCAWLLAGVGPVSPGWLAATVGIAGGIGVGLAYLVPVATAMAWFPNHRALVTGVAVAGFGGGAALLGGLADYAMGSLGWSVQQTLRALGAVFLAIVPAAGGRMRLPHVEREPADPLTAPVSARDVLGSAAFRLLTLTFTAGLSAGLAVNGNLRQLGSAAPEGVSLVPLFALGNAAGRIGWGALGDRLAAGPLLAANLGLWTVLLGTASYWTASAWGLPFFAALAGVLYGGVLVIHPAVVAGRWGARQFMRAYGWLCAAHVIAAWAPSIAGWVYDQTGAFQRAFVALAVFSGASAVMAWHRRALLQAAP